MTSNEDLIFVELALKRELVTQEQVDEILALQRKLESMGLSESVADLMVKKGKLKEEDAQALRVKVSPKGGRQQIEGYKLVERLGRGGMGSVYKAIQISMNRPVALKVLKPSLTKDDSSTARLRREAQLVGKLRHPNIVQGLDFGVSNNFHYFAMEYVDGESVKQVLESHGPYKEKEAIRIVREVALALDHAHREGVVHRDIKPGNILVARDGTVKLADYGLAKGPLEDVELTHSGVTVGTPQYISPEQAQGPSEVDIRTDLYSLGATLYHMVTGRPPYQGETLAHLIQQVLYEPYAPPRSLRRDLSKEVSFLIEKLMARRPRHRYQSPKELLRDLDAIGKGRSIVPVGWQGDFEAFFLRRRLRRLTIAAVAIILLGGIGSGLVFWQYDRMKKQEAERDAMGEYQRWADVKVRPIGLDEVIRELQKIPDKYPGTKGARLAEERLDALRETRKHCVGVTDLIAEAGKSIGKGEWADAISALERGLAELEPKEHSELARVSLEAHIGEVKKLRDGAIPQEFEKKVESLVAQGKSPEEALDEARRFWHELENRGFTVGESRGPLEPAMGVVQGLDRAIRGTGEYLSRPEALLDEDTLRKDYEEIDAELEKAKSAFDADTGLQQILETLEPSWAKNLRTRFPELAQRIIDANDEEAGKALSRVKELEDQNRFEEAVALLEDLIARSVPDIAAKLHSVRDGLQATLERNQMIAESSWGAFLPSFLELMGRRHWEAARQELARLDERVRSYSPNPYADELLPASEQTLNFAVQVEAEFVKRVDGADRLSELTFGGIKMKDVRAVRVEGRQLHFLYGGPHVRTLEEVGVEDLFRHAQVDRSQNQAKLVHAVLWLGEAERAGAPRKLLATLPEIEREILEARESPILEPLVDEILAHVRARAVAATEAIQQFEDLAAGTFEKAKKALDEGRYQEAFDEFSRLLEKEALSDTKFVKDRLTLIQDYRDEAKRKLPTVDLGGWFKTKVEHLAGDDVRDGYQAALTFDLEDEEQLTRMKFSEGRIGIIEIEKLPLGPNPPGTDPDEERVEIQHLLRFRPPKSIPEDYLDRHPLTMECPFLYSKEMSIRFKARWERPVALLLSLCGTNVVVLSDDGRKEDGRGVHIWQGTDLADPDLIVPQELRKTWIDRHPDALKGDASNGQYFQFEPDRWYSVRFVKGEKFAALYVDERLVYEVPIKRYGAKGEDIVILTYTPMRLDEIRIEGTVDPEWYRSRVMRAARAAKREGGRSPK